MNRNVIIIGVCIIGLSVYKTVDLWRSSQDKHARVTLLEHDVAALREQASALNRVKDGVARTILENYGGVEEFIRVLGVFGNLKRSVEILDAKDAEDVHSAIKPSAWPGISQLQLKVNFFDVIGEDQYMRILEVLNELRARYTVNVASIHQAGNGLEVRLDVFGK